MKYVQFDNGIEASALAVGCMRIGGMDKEALLKLIETALEHGINAFDHADIYGGGTSESLFGKVLAREKGLREKLFIQSKCGIREGYYDFSKEHILEAVDGSLKRLSTDHLDMLLLHRPDVLMDLEEVAEAFDELERSGKVLGFGVSNMNPMQIELLQEWTHKRIQADQVQFSAAHTKIVDEGIHFNMSTQQSPMRSGGILEYARLHNIVLQSWSSLQYGFIEGTFLGHESFAELNEALEETGSHYGVSKAACAIAWILRCPGVGQAIVGTTNPERLSDLAKACSFTMTRKEWYRIYQASGNRLP